MFGKTATYNASNSDTGNTACQNYRLLYSTLTTIQFRVQQKYFSFKNVVTHITILQIIISTQSQLCLILLPNSGLFWSYVRYCLQLSTVENAYCHKHIICQIVHVFYALVLTMEACQSYQSIDD